MTRVVCVQRRLDYYVCVFFVHLLTFFIHRAAVPSPLYGRHNKIFLPTTAIIIMWMSPPVGYIALLLLAAAVTGSRSVRDWCCRFIQQCSIIWPYQCCEMMHISSKRKIMIGRDPYDQNHEEHLLSLGERGAKDPLHIPNETRARVAWSPLVRALLLRETNTMSAIILPLCASEQGTQLQRNN